MKGHGRSASAVALLYPASKKDSSKASPPPRPRAPSCSKWILVFGGKVVLVLKNRRELSRRNLRLIFND